MAIIEIEKLAKSYRVYQKREGLWASMRGLFRREYEGRTLRENLGLPRPPNRFFPVGRDPAA